MPQNVKINFRYSYQIFNNFSKVIDMNKKTISIAMPPVVIGGCGGSGTRVVASLLQECGFNIGDDLNDAQDNLLFTFLFRVPRHHNKASKNAEYTNDLILLYKNLFFGQRSILIKNWNYIPQIWEHLFCSVSFKFPYSLIWIVRRFLKIFSSKSRKTGRWGWKEPNSQIYLKELVHYFPEMKYIHVIRNGFDMAYSRNQLQLHNWGHLYSISKAEIEGSLPQASLKYWVRSNTHSISTAKELLGQSCLVVRFEDLCMHPEKTSLEIIKFLGVDEESCDLGFMKGLVVKPSTMGRYKSYDLDHMASEDIDGARLLGYPLES